MPRLLGILFGIVTHVIFLTTVYYLFQFLHASADASATSTSALWIDALLALQFTIPHSLLLHPRIRSRLETKIGTAFYGLFFCVATCLQLALIFALWQTSPIVVWNLTGAAGAAMEAAFYGSWIALFYSLWLTGLGYQTGLTPWLYWLRGHKPPRRTFDPRGAYRLLRHPVYLSFLGLIWFHPLVTLDKLMLIAIWTPYVFVGSMLKDERLRFYLKDRYRDYQSQVAGYPGVWFGPLGRVPKAPPPSEPLAALPAARAS